MYLVCKLPRRIQMAFVIVGLVVLWAADASLTRDGKQYIFNTASAHWNAAADTCKVNGASLATIVSQRDYDALEELKNQFSFSVDRYWIGLYNKGPGYVWMDCSTPNTLDFHQWFASGPNLTNHCGQVKKHDTRWYSVSCEEYAPFVCEKNTGPCTFSVDVSNADNGDPPSALDSSTSTLSECQTKCNDVTKCEYIVYSATTTTCYLYASKPYGAPPETGTSTGYTRECYTGINGNYNINHGANSGRLPALTACENVTFSTAGERAETTVVTRARTEPPTTTSALSTVPASTTATMSPTSISTSTSTSTSTSSSTLESTAISGTSRLPIGTTTTDALRQAITSAVFRSTQSNPASATGATTGLSTNSATGATTGRSANSATGATTGLSTNSATGATTGRSANSATGATTESSGNSMTGSTSAQNSIEMGPNSTLPSSVNAPLSDSPSTCCHCLKPDMTPEEKGAFTESILARLSLNTRTTSAHVRTLTSASDSRISATAVGCTGLVFLTIVFGGIVLLDLGRLVSDLKMFKNNLKELLHSK